MNDLACRDFAKAVALVDEPLVDDQLYDFGLVSECFLQAGFVVPCRSPRPALSPAFGVS